MRSLVMSIFLYACETWAITADIERRTQALEMRYFRKFLGILHRDHITNEEMETRIGNAIGQFEDLLTSVKRRLLKWYGHLDWPRLFYRESYKEGDEGAEETMGRQHQEWTGLEWNIMLRKAEDSE